MEEWGYECNLKLDFFATQGGRGGQGRGLVERTPELFRGFDQCRALRRPQSGFAPQRRGFLDLPRLGAVTRQQLGLILRDLRELTSRVRRLGRPPIWISYGRATSARSPLAQHPECAPAQPQTHHWPRSNGDGTTG